MEGGQAYEATIIPLDHQANLLLFDGKFLGWIILDLGGMLDRTTSYIRMSATGVSVGRWGWACWCESAGAGFATQARQFTVGQRYILVRRWDASIHGLHSLTLPYWEDFANENSKFWSTVTVFATDVGREDTELKPLTHPSIEMQITKHNTITTKCYRAYRQGQHICITRSRS